VRRRFAAVTSNPAPRFNAAPDSPKRNLRLAIPRRIQRLRAAQTSILRRSAEPPRINSRANRAAFSGEKQSATVVC
ncbi:MAG: hypothetical protein IJI03_14335, partial [Rudaea sp.]|nr:hypothetical protein [Rudaea sp.]